MGYPDTVPNSQGWQIGTSNQCMSCPYGTNSCPANHNSPINLDRNLNVQGSKIYNECIDGHYIRHLDSSCSYDELRQKNAFTVERYGLKINQPIAETQESSGFYNIDCQGQPGLGRRWGRMDYPKGWSHWWLLSHIDFHVPSEHTQNGKRYDAELQLHHYYSVSPEECFSGAENTIGAISIFIDAYDDADDWDMLNKAICAWREGEEKNRRSCGLPSVKEAYPGCYYYNRDGSSPTTNTTWGTNTTSTTSVQGVRRGQSHVTEEEVYKPARSALDLLLENHMMMSTGNATYEPKRLQIDPENLESADDFDWDSFIYQEIEREDSYKRIKQEGKVESEQDSRNLMNYASLGWYNYFPMTAVRTEYYYRYSGSQTMPPCYGKFETNSAKRANTLGWRVMKDPIRVSHRQINEMHRLIKNRIAPKDSLRNSCKPDTGAAPHPDGDPDKIWVARPLQANENAHWGVFCECLWRSHFWEDKDWCKIDDQNTKYFEHPYNFEHVGF
jgi:carbonic anhydrase